MSHVDTSLAELLVTAKDVIRTLSRNDCMLGLSESVTGGMIASCLTRVDGCSKVLFASQVLYSILGKASFCGLDVKQIAEKGTVSEYTVFEMLDSMARRYFKVRTDTGLPGVAIAPRCFMSLGTSGIAGDSIEGLPRGTVLAGIAVYHEDGTMIEKEIHRYEFEGDRWEIMVAATSAALGLVLEKAALFNRA